MVDGGSNVKARTSYNEKTPRIVVSRSHSGMVKQVALQTFGNQTTIIPAGGAGTLQLPCSAGDSVKANVGRKILYSCAWEKSENGECTLQTGMVSCLVISRVRFQSYVPSC